MIVKIESYPDDTGYDAQIYYLEVDQDSWDQFINLCTQIYKWGRFNTDYSTLTEEVRKLMDEASSLLSAWVSISNQTLKEKTETKTRIQCYNEDEGWVVVTTAHSSYTLPNVRLRRVE